jgi:hypothetical protein
MRLRQRHLATPESVAAVAIPVTSAGLVLGRDQQRSLVVVRLFRPQPTMVALVGGWWAARLVAARALAVGARVVVRTVSPGQWQGFGEAMTGRSDRVDVFSGEGAAPPAADVAQPVLEIVDVGPAGPQTRPELGAWQSRLTLLPELTDAGVRPVEEADLAIVQRLTEPEARTAIRAMRLAPEAAGHLQMLADDMLAIVGGSTDRQADRYLWVVQTPTEQAHLGPPRRA